MTKHTVFIVGAGATKGTFPADAPGVKGFGRALKAVWREWPDELRVLHSAVRDAQPAAGDGWDLDTVWTHIDYYAKFHGALNEPDSGASGQLHQAIVAVYGHLGARTADLFSGRGSASGSALRQILQTVRAGDVVASFNWDTLVESILDRLGLFPAGSFVKPHGSLSWIASPDRPLHIPDQPPGLLEVPDRRTVHDRFEPILLGAVPIKSELIKEVQNGNGKYDLVIRQWGVLTEAIKSAARFVAIGYSFPPEDHYGMFILRRALVRRPSPLEEVGFYEIEGQASVVAERIHRLLPAPETRVTWLGPVEEGLLP
jgi:hypothetical protein